MGRYDTRYSSGGTARSERVAQGADYVAIGKHPFNRKEICRLAGMDPNGYMRFMRAVEEGNVEELLTYHERLAIKKAVISSAMEFFEILGLPVKAKVATVAKPPTKPPTKAATKAPTKPPTKAATKPPTKPPTRRLSLPRGIPTRAKVYTNKSRA